jgi:hypothetical protein
MEDVWLDNHRGPTRLTIAANSIFNGWCMADVWLDR